MSCIYCFINNQVVENEYVYGTIHKLQDENNTINITFQGENEYITINDVNSDRLNNIINDYLDNDYDEEDEEDDDCKPLTWDDELEIPDIEFDDDFLREIFWSYCGGCFCNTSFKYKVSLHLCQCN